jgi:putative transposase
VQHQHVPRRLRVIVPDGVYHVTGRGNRGQDVYLDNHDRRFFLEVFGMVAARLGWRCYTYCLLSNHYHLVVQTPNADLSEGMRVLNGEHAQWFNRRHSATGHLFQGRFHSVLVESDWHLLELVRYVALNPVRAGLCEDPAEWHWGSFRALAGNHPLPAFVAPDAVLGLFGRDPERARKLMSDFVTDVPLPGLAS